MIYIMKELNINNYILLLFSFILFNRCIMVLNKFSIFSSTMISILALSSIGYAMDPEELAENASSPSMAKRVNTSSSSKSYVLPTDDGTKYYLAPFSEKQEAEINSHRRMTTEEVLAKDIASDDWFIRNSARYNYGELLSRSKLMASNLSEAAKYLIAAHEENFPAATFELFRNVMKKNMDIEAQTLFYSTCKNLIERENLIGEQGCNCIVAGLQLYAKRNPDLNNILNKFQDHELLKIKNKQHTKSSKEEDDNPEEYCPKEEDLGKITTEIQKIKFSLPQQKELELNDEEVDLSGFD